MNERWNANAGTFTEMILHPPDTKALLEWLEGQREKERYLEVFEFAPPEDGPFDPVPVP